MFIIDLFIKTGLETLYLTGAIILAGLLLGFLENQSNRNFQRSLGRNAIMVTGIIGTPIHELSHALTALIFGHRITDIKLFQRPDQDGVMGYVNHSYNPKNIYHQVGNFFIGIAPIFGGLLVIMVLMGLLIPQVLDSFMTILTAGMTVDTLSMASFTGVFTAYLELVKLIFAWENFQNITFYLFLFLAICISAHISLSPADIKGAFKGLIFIFIILLLLNAIGLSQSILVFDVLKYNVLITSFLMIAVIFSLITFFISLVSRIFAK
nr:M50 family metallopeptidase [uncultured Acetobacterium sp.]